MQDAESSAPRSAIKVLLVEDDEPTLELLSLFLARFYSIVTCSSGERALHALYTVSDIDLIVTDLRMPAVNGFDVLRCATEYSRLIGKPIPAIALTGHGTLEDESRARSLGVTHFHRKPIDLTKLRTEIESCCSTGALACSGLISQAERTC